MRQSKFTKTIALMLSLVMITSVFVGNTLSRYVTSVSSTDSARVAIWGINGKEVTMNLFDTKYIMDGKEIARYDSSLFGYDYVITIFDECDMDDESVLMIFASYVSDKRADSQN